MDTVFAICVGIGLSAACGFRIFLPLLCMSLAAKTDLLHLNQTFGWLASWPAVAALSTATVLEIGAHFVPWIDHAVSAAATPAAILAGTLATAAQIDGINPLAQWAGSLAVGGSIAGGTHLLNLLVRGVSTISTAGVGAPIVTLAQSAVSVVLAILAIVVPIFAVLVIALVVAMVIRRRRARRGRVAVVAA